MKRAIRVLGLVIGLANAAWDAGACGDGVGAGALAAVDPARAARIVSAVGALKTLWEAVPFPAGKFEFNASPQEKLEREEKVATYKKSNIYKTVTKAMCDEQLADGHYVSPGSIVIAHPSLGSFNVSNADWHYLSAHAQAPPGLVDDLEKYLGLVHP